MHPVIQEFEAHQALAWEYRENYDAMAPNLRGRLDESKGGHRPPMTRPWMLRAARGMRSPKYSMMSMFSDAVGAGRRAQGIGLDRRPRYNRLWTLMGVPCVNVPTLIAEGGLPVGVKVIARYGADAKALAAARFVEQALKR